MQEEGSYIRENLKDPHFFTRRMLEDFRIYEKYADIVVISDVRLIPEIEDIKAKYQDVMAIQVKGEQNSYLTKKQQSHITERELVNYPYFDKIIENTNQTQLNQSAKEIVKELFK